MSTVLVTGASSYLASRLIPIACEFADVIGVIYKSNELVSPSPNTRVDISDAAAVDRLFEQVKPDAVIHAAAVNPGGSNHAMEQVNHIGSRNVAVAAARHGCRLVAVSSDVVHNGLAAPYADDAVADPINVYGRTKALGEQAMLTACPSAAIVRTSLIYGLESMDRGTKGFAEQLQSGQRLSLYKDVIRQPVWIDSLSTALCRLAFEFRSESGLINVVGTEAMSRAEFGLKMLSFWNVDSSTLVDQIAADGKPGLPMDLRMLTTRARALSLRLPGVNTVLSNHR